MNEIDWLSGTDAVAMLAYVESRISDRKLRLFACACVRRYWARLDWNRRSQRFHIEDEEQRIPVIISIPRQAVELAENFAEGFATAQEVEAFRPQAEMAGMYAPEFDRFVFLAATATLAEQAREAARTVSDLLRQQAIRDALEEEAFSSAESQEATQAAQIEHRRQGAILRELLGNPFRRCEVDPTWLNWGDATVANMARWIKQERRFEEMPYLGDALVDAGCDNEYLIRHCREPVTNHRRGCWALDALLPTEQA